MIRKRLVEEVEDKGILPEGQAGFRKGRSTTDNIFILNHIIQMAKIRKENIYSVFVDLKAVFDMVNRKKLWIIMEELGISQYIIERIKELYEETKVKVRKEEEYTEQFWTEKGLRQGCLLSPILFCIYIAGLEKEYEKRNVGGVKIGKKRVWTLVYADDIVLLAYNREAILNMLATLKIFLKSRDLVLSTEKTKVMICHKSTRGKKNKNSSQEKWKWGGEEIEEVKSFKYLGFTFNALGNYKDHLRELAKKGIVTAKMTWGLGENKCKNNFKRRKMLYNCLVKSVMGYGAEIWGWAERKELEKVQCDYYRWVLRLDIWTPRYIIYKETNTRKMERD